MVESSSRVVDKSCSTRVRRERKSLASEEVGDDTAMTAAIVLSSSDDEEANRDLSLEILEKARRLEKTKQSSKKTEKVYEFVDLTSSEEVEVEEKMKKKRKKKRGKKNKNLRKEGEEKAVMVIEDKEPKFVLDTEAALQEEDHFVAADSVVTELNEAPDNVVLKKLLRGPRYFDAEGCNWKFCYNCSEEGHTAANCRSEKRQKPCFFCGVLGHDAKRCPKRSSQGLECFICKIRGHIAKDCPDKENKNIQNSKVCLRCGDHGHEMSCCTNSYTPEDVKEIQCYVCKSFGHLCCVDAICTSPRVISCYNCGLTGHYGLGCAKVHSQLSAADLSPTLCYNCGEEGHFARGCTKNAKTDKWMGEPSTPISKVKRKRDYSGSRSTPYDFGKSHKKKNVYHEERAWTAAKSRPKGGWMVDDPRDFLRDEYNTGEWRDPSMSKKKARQYSSDSQKSMRYMGWSSSDKSHKPFPKPPMCSSGHYQNNPSAHYRPAYSASRFGNSGGHYRNWFDQF